MESNDEGFRVPPAKGDTSLKNPQEEEKQRLDKGTCCSAPKNVKPLEKREKRLGIQGDDSSIFDSKNLADGEVIGHGKKATVKKMLHMPTNTIVAVKIWDTQKSDERVQEAKEELADLAKWDCKYVVKVLGGVYEENHIRLCLEYMNKGSLADILKKIRVIPEPLLGIIAYQCLKGLEYYHTVPKIKYRELRPSNILINSDGDIKLADVTSITEFGVFTLSYTWPTSLFYYSSPEAIRGDIFTENRDTWSLGIILLECALGVNPYQTDSPDRLKFFDLVDIINTKPAPTLPDSFSEEFRDFISKCVVKDLNFRLCATELLKHKFIKKAESQSRQPFKAWLEQIE